MDNKQEPIEGQSHLCDGFTAQYEPCSNVVRNDSDHCSAGHKNQLRVSASGVLLPAVDLGSDEDEEEWGSLSVEDIAGLDEQGKADYTYGTKIEDSLVDSIGEDNDRYFAYCGAYRDSDGVVSCQLWQFEDIGHPKLVIACGTITDRRYSTEVPGEDWFVSTECKSRVKGGHGGDRSAFAPLVSDSWYGPDRLPDPMERQYAFEDALDEAFRGPALCMHHRALLQEAH